MKDKKNIKNIFFTILKSIILLLISDISTIACFIFCGAPVEFFLSELLFWIQIFIIMDIIFLPMTFLVFFK